ncbi:MAG: phytase [Bacteroidetes bacterium]|nr:phytase [Bacteroidota bacterium]
MKHITGIFTLFVGFAVMAQERTSVCSFALPQVEATLETEAVVSYDDAADDICIWENPNDATTSIVVATDKKYGLITYNLQGKKLHQYPVGRPNNVAHFVANDILKNDLPLICASNRTKETITFAFLNPDGSLAEIQDIKVPLKEVYGITTYLAEKPYIIVSTKKGKVWQYQVGLQGKKVRMALVRKLKFGKTVEGLVVDPTNKKLYVAEEERGLWQLNALPWQADEKTMILKVDKEKLKPDFEGLALRENKDGSGWIVMSVQGSNAYAFIDRQTLKLKNIIQIKDGVVDGVQETDGLEVSSLKTPTFPNGLLIVQDGENGNEPQNFKYINWAHIQPHLNP